MLRKSIVAIAMLGSIATLAHGAEAAKKDPKTGKNCVTLLSSESTIPGLLRVNFRNTCDSPFQVQILASTRTRETSISAGTPESPSKAYVTCKLEDSCESAKWQYE